MKKIITLMVSTVFAIFFAMGTVSASSEMLSSDGNKEFLKVQILKSIQEEYPNAQFIEKAEIPNQSIVPFQGAASPLTSLNVYAAISTIYPQYEYFSENQLASIEDHGGDEMYIVTREIGYSSNTSRIAQMDGVNISMLMQQDIDLNGDNIVDGVFRWWDASGYEKGKFTYQATSINYPWNTMNTWMNIR
ncbi:DUF4879 domain-containing protein [Paraliobacillus sp. JSM ZJ581]|uniref:DUF4879 domain-containing protein n=1 Tax=Paraliobacillus sp. JSM ZJ581 TaxID=3342118 RepID=UPI0035A95363